MSKSGVKAVDAKGSVLSEKDGAASSPAFEPLAVSTAVPEDAELTLNLLTRDLVGRPGLDSGTLGLKEACRWSDSSGEVGIIRDSKKICPVVSESSRGVGLVCGMECGITERVMRPRTALLHQ